MDAVTISAEREHVPFSRKAKAESMGLPGFRGKGKMIQWRNINLEANNAAIEHGKLDLHLPELYFVHFSGDVFAGSRGRMDLSVQWVPNEGLGYFGLLVWVSALMLV